ncbi:isochorismatase family protein [Sphingorhabdus arenilitoris]|uniref:Isochorismatase family protein n=1 Tax=Sphingorhabdus arenilitoris TaxID=1490041 RepID=A0ABV8RGU8_9SPHN
MPRHDGLTQSYTDAFGGRLEFGSRPALLIVDFVMAYLDPQSPFYAGVEDALGSNVRLLAAARMAAMPVFFTNVEYEHGGGNGGLFYQKIPALRVFEKGSPLGAFPPQLAPRNGETVITKQYASAFFGTDLTRRLRQMDIDTLIITGLSTSGCVRATALDALQNGFAPFVVREACGDRHPAPHEANLFDLQAKYAEVISEAEAIEFMSSE